MMESRGRGCSKVLPRVCGSTHVTVTRDKYYTMLYENFIVLQRDVLGKYVSSIRKRNLNIITCSLLGLSKSR